MNDDLVRAIRGRRLIEVVYGTGGERIVEPHDYGVRGGIERLLVFQIAGASDSGAHGWKSLDVAKIRRVRVLERRFPGSRGDSAQHHLHWDTLFARVE